MKARRTVPFLLLLVLPTAFFPPFQKAAGDLRLVVHEALAPVWASAQFVSVNLSGGTRRLGEFVNLYRNYQALEDEVEGLRRCSSICADRAMCADQGDAWPWPPARKILRKPRGFP